MAERDSEDAALNHSEPVVDPLYLATGLLPRDGLVMSAPAKDGEWPIHPSPNSLDILRHHLRCDFAARKSDDKFVMVADQTDVMQVSHVDEIIRHSNLLEAFAVLSGTSGKTLFKINVPKRRRVPKWPGMSLAEVRLVDDRFLAGPCQIQDIWMSTQLDMNLALGGLEGGPGEVGMTLRAYQCDLSSTSTLRRVGAAELDPSGPNFVRLVLDNPWSAVLIELTDKMDDTIALCVLPFPSLVRGGLHYAEFIALGGAGGAFEHLARYAELRAHEYLASQNQRKLGLIVGLHGTTGVEVLLQPSTSSWLSRLGCHQMTSPIKRGRTQQVKATSRLKRMPKEAEGWPQIWIQADSIPTIAALTGGAFDWKSETGGADLRLASCLVAEEATGRPLWSVTIPDDPELLQFQSDAVPPNFPMVCHMPRAVLPVSIRLKSDHQKPTAARLLGVSLDLVPPLLGRITDSPQLNTLCLLEMSELAQTARSLFALSAQEGTTRLRIEVVVPSHITAAEMDGLTQLLARYPQFSASVSALSQIRMQDVAQVLAASKDCSAIFFLKDTVILHDYRTFETITRILTTEGTASSACVLMREDVARKADWNLPVESGYFPDQMRFSGGPRLVLGQRENLLDALPTATFPVFANTLSATLVSRAALEEIGVARLDAATFGLLSLRLGYRNLCTSVVRGTILHRNASSEIMDPFGALGVPLGEWPGLMARISQLEEVR